MQQVDIYNRAISVFPNIASKQHHTRTIGAFLNGGTHYAGTIEKARQVIAKAFDHWSNGNRAAYDAALEQYKRLKGSLPVAIMQGVCPDAHDAGMDSYADVICLDIDREKPHKEPNGNEWIEQTPGGWEYAKKLIAAFPFVAYCGLSVGGHGLFVLIPVADGRKHAAHWRALVRVFSALNLAVDKATKNPARKRIISIDPAAYINHDAQVFSATEEEPTPQPAQAPRPVAYHVPNFYTGASDFDRAQYCVNTITRNGIDITANYNDWLQAAAAIAHEFGERGNTMFHDIARQSPMYKFEENETLYTRLQAIPDTGRQCSIATFFYLCQRYGVDVPKAERNDYSPRKRTRTKTLPTPPPPVPGSRPGSMTTPEPPTTATTTPMPQAQATDTTHDVAPAFVPQPMTPAEALEMQHRVQHIAEGVAMVDAKREQDPTFSEFCDLFECDYCGHDDWHMTAAQFDNFFAERHNATPPF